MMVGPKCDIRMRAVMTVVVVAACAAVCCAQLADDARLGDDVLLRTLAEYDLYELAEQIHSGDDRDRQLLAMSKSIEQVRCQALHDDGLTWSQRDQLWANACDLQAQRIDRFTATDSSDSDTIFYDSVRARWQLTLAEDILIHRLPSRAAMPMADLPIDPVQAEELHTLAGRALELLDRAGGWAERLFARIDGFDDRALSQILFDGSSHWAQYVQTRSRYLGAWASCYAAVGGEYLTSVDSDERTHYERAIRLGLAAIEDMQAEPAPATVIMLACAYRRTGQPPRAIDILNNALTGQHGALAVQMRIQLVAACVDAGMYGLVPDLLDELEVRIARLDDSASVLLWRLAAAAQRARYMLATGGHDGDTAADVMENVETIRHRRADALAGILQTAHDHPQWANAVELLLAQLARGYDPPELTASELRAVADVASRRDQPERVVSVLDELLNRDGLSPLELVQLRGQFAGALFDLGQVDQALRVCLDIPLDKVPTDILAGVLTSAVVKGITAIDAARPDRQDELTVLWCRLAERLVQVQPASAVSRAVRSRLAGRYRQLERPIDAARVLAAADADDPDRARHVLAAAGIMLHSLAESADADNGDGGDGGMTLTSSRPVVVLPDQARRIAGMTLDACTEMIADAGQDQQRVCEAVQVSARLAIHPFVGLYDAGLDLLQRIRTSGGCAAHRIALSTIEIVGLHRRSREQDYTTAAKLIASLIDGGADKALSLATRHLRVRLERMEYVDPPVGLSAGMADELTPLAGYLRDQVRQYMSAYDAGDDSRSTDDDVAASRPSPEVRYVQAAYWLAVFDVAQQRYDSALDLLTVLDGWYPDDPAISWSYGRALLRIGRYESAAIEFYQLLSCVPRYERMWWQALAGNLEAHTLLEDNPQAVIDAIVTRRARHPDMGGADLADRFEYLLKLNQQATGTP